jgi:hypothetical protein
MPRPSFKVEVPCQWCGKQFLIKRSEVARGGGKHCSRECYRARGPSSMWRLFKDRVGEPNEHGCLLWQGTLRRGYGVIQTTHKDAPARIYYAHRFAFEVANGPIPEGMSVLHMCDEFYPKGDFTCRACVNPLHLYMGTHADNMADKVASGRQINGEACYLSKLTADAVRDIRKRCLAGGETKAQIARDHDISIGNVYAIINRRSWAHVD